MTSTTAKKLCTKCNIRKIATCLGCKQLFCPKHFLEHRKELGQEMDKIGQEHALLRRELTRENAAHPLLSRIDNWELESIIKIQLVAEAARADLRQRIDRTKNELTTSIDRMTKELQSSRESGDCMEIDLKRWINELNELRKKLERPSNLHITDDIRASSHIRLIQVTEHEQTDIPFEPSASTCQELIHFANERFEATVKEVTLSEENLVATFSRYTRFSAEICGINRYSSGIHRIRFRIDRKGPQYMVFGIMTSSQDLVPSSLAPSVYGWWDLDYPIINGLCGKLGDKKTIQTDDQLTLTLDCDNGRIELVHHRSQRLVHLLISVCTCPLPWKLLVGMHSEGDCVRILH